MRRFHFKRQTEVLNQFHFEFLNIHSIKNEISTLPESLRRKSRLFLIRMFYEFQSRGIRLKKKLFYYFIVLSRVCSDFYDPSSGTTKKIISRINKCF